jgi:hypothetical protein
MPAIWNLFNCYLSGRHDYGMSCEKGAMFLSCTHCGRRSSGWVIEPKSRPPVVAAAAAQRVAKPRAPRVLPFGRAAAG